MDDRIGRMQIAGLFAVYLVLAVVVPAFDDEVYYWSWSKELQWSYYDHPPMTAYLIRLSTTIFGDTVLGMRFPACVASAFVVYVIRRLTPFKPLIWGVIFTPLFTFGAVLMTPDSPLIMFWAAYVWWLVELHRRWKPQLEEEMSEANTVSCPDASTPRPCPQMTMWIIGGVILGCGVLSKYTMGLAVPTAFASLLIARRPWREWLPGYVLHGVVAFVVALPILIYNISQDFEPLLYQWQHAAEKTPYALLSFCDFVGAQMLLFGTMPFVLFPWVILNARRLWSTPRLRVCWCLFTLPLAFFLYKSTQTRLQGNWALICFISFWPLASDWYDTVRNSPSWRLSSAASFLPPVLAVVAIIVHGISPSSLVPIKGDRIYRAKALNTATLEIAKKIREHGETLPVYTDSYQMTALLRFQSLDARQIDGLTRPSVFTRPPRRLTDVDRAYVVTEQPLSADFATGFQPPELVSSIPVVVRGTNDRTLNIWIYQKSEVE